MVESEIMALSYDWIEIVGSPTDDIEDEGNLSGIYVVKEILPYFEAQGDNVEKVGGSIKASRWRQLHFKVEYAPFLVYDEITGINSFGDYLKILAICNFNFVFINDTNLFRSSPSGEVYDVLFPIKVELISDDLSSDLEHGCNHYSQIFRSREYYNIDDLPL